MSELGAASASVLRGPLRACVNDSRDSAGTIHTDAVAKKLGFRGGAVAGPVHLDLVPPVALDIFGTRWFESGYVSMAFKNPALDGEQLRACVRRPTVEAATDAWVEREDGLVIAEGAVGVGPGPTPFASNAQPGPRRPPLRILAGVKPGTLVDPDEVLLAGDRQRDQLDRGAIAEPLEWYSGGSPWRRGAAIASPFTSVAYLFRPGAAVLYKHAAGALDAVPLFGAVEMRYSNGPLHLDSWYRLSGAVLSLGESPKTEFAWYEVHADGLDGKQRVATLRIQLRWMKASSRFYST